MKDFLKTRRVLIDQGMPADRHTGRTLGIAFEAIGAALQNPRTPISYHDHYDDRRAHDNLTSQIEDLLVTLELEGFHLNKNARTLYYDPS